MKVSEREARVDSSSSSSLTLLLSSLPLCTPPFQSSLVHSPEQHSVMDQSIPIAHSALTQPPPSMQDFPLMQQAKLSLSDSSTPSTRVQGGEDAKLQVGKLLSIYPFVVCSMMTATFPSCTNLPSSDSSR